MQETANAETESQVMTDNSARASQTLTTIELDRKQEQSLLSLYGDPEDEQEGFIRDIEYANHLLTENENVWLTVAEQENAVNSALLALWEGFDNIDESPSATCHSGTWNYREKVFRNLRFVARLEAISGQNLEFRFVTQYARYIYPKLLATTKRSQALQLSKIEPKSHLSSVGAK